jgi:hypothetical protein
VELLANMDGGKNEGHYCSIININQTIIKAESCLNKKKNPWKYLFANK